jgi:TPR repeat protein
MHESFAAILAVGGKSNSLGRASEVIEAVLHDKARLKELYGCLFNEDAWVRMRAADSLEKICRVHPDWLELYIDRISKDLAGSNQASIQWHIAQIYRQVALSASQKHFAINWLEKLLSSAQIDWIVAANAMDTMAQFVRSGSVSKTDFRALLKIQCQHKSNAVIKRASRLLHELP